jgi:hypothetical protein
MYSGDSFSKMVGTTGWMAPEVYDTQVSIKNQTHNWIIFGSGFGG